MALQEMKALTDFVNHLRASVLSNASAPPRDIEAN